MCLFNTYLTSQVSYTSRVTFLLLHLFNVHAACKEMPAETNIENRTLLTQPYSSTLFWYRKLLKDFN